MINVNMKCICDNEQHDISNDVSLDGCSISSEKEFCEWCLKGCQKRKKV
jgi:hypothetical protein